MMMIPVTFECDRCESIAEKMVEVAIRDGHLSPSPILPFQMPLGWERFYDPTAKQTLMQCAACVRGSVT